MIKIEEKHVFNIIYDGKEFSKEEFNKISEEEISDIVASSEKLKNGTIYAFSDRKILEEWVQSTEYYDKYKNIMKKLETVKPELTEEKEIELELLQSSAIHHSTNHILNELKPKLEKMSKRNSMIFFRHNPDKKI
ncbi:MAG: hypothetical protein ACFFCC_20225 [Promethearchaeota archaeon]